MVPQNYKAGPRVPLNLPCGWNAPSGLGCAGAHWQIRPRGAFILTSCAALCLPCTIRDNCRHPFTPAYSFSAVFPVRLRGGETNAGIYRLSGAISKAPQAAEREMNSAYAREERCSDRARWAAARQFKRSRYSHRKRYAHFPDPRRPRLSSARLAVCEAGRQVSAASLQIRQNLAESHHDRRPAADPLWIHWTRGGRQERDAFKHGVSSSTMGHPVPSISIRSRQLCPGTPA